MKLLSSIQRNAIKDRGDKMPCESCNVECENENTCSVCNSCEKCDDGCQVCDTCQRGCQSSQAFCAVGSQVVGSFSFNQDLDTDDEFFTKANWNRLITYIRNAYSKGRKQNGGDSGLPSSDSNQFMTADMFNKVSAALGGLGSSGPRRRVTKEQIIYGSYFKDLESYADSLEYKSNQCDSCNSSCDVTCLGCQTCDSGCEKCNIQNCGKCNGSCQSGHVRVTCSASA